jgi:hypothetical protein
MTYPDYDKPDSGMDDGGSRSVWVRGAFMLLLLICFSIAHTVLGAMAFVQFLWMLITRERNAFLADFGFSLGRWMEEAAHFLTGASDRKPFPWEKWPTV